VKINIVGTSGSGKSTFAKAIAQATGHPYLQIDKLFWLPNWTMPTDSDFAIKLKQTLSENETWILDGNYDRFHHIKWEQVDMVIWLDYSFTGTLYQVTKRSILRSIKREELWEGTNNRESFYLNFFHKDSVIWWMITTHKKMRQRYQAHMNDPKFSHIKFVRIKNRREAADLLRTLRIKKPIPGWQ
jgi:adenylate kinase family enzyme